MGISRDPGLSLKEKLRAARQSERTWQSLLAQIVMLSVMAVLVMTFGRP